MPTRRCTLLPITQNVSCALYIADISGHKRVYYSVVMAGQGQGGRGRKKTTRVWGGVQPDVTSMIALQESGILAARMGGLLPVWFPHSLVVCDAELHAFAEKNGLNKDGMLLPSLAHCFSYCANCTKQALTSNKHSAHYSFAWLGQRQKFQGCGYLQGQQAVLRRHQTCVQERDQPAIYSNANSCPERQGDFSQLYLAANS